MQPIECQASGGHDVEGSKQPARNPVLFQQRRILLIRLFLFRPVYEIRRDFRCLGVSNPTLSATHSQTFGFFVRGVESGFSGAPSAFGLGLTASNPTGAPSAFGLGLLISKDVHVQSVALTQAP